MKTIKNEVVTFRCTNDLKDRIIEYGYDNELDMSEVIRRACNALVKRRQPPPDPSSNSSRLWTARTHYEE